MAFWRAETFFAYASRQVKQHSNICLQFGKNQELQLLNQAKWKLEGIPVAPTSGTQATQPGCSVTAHSLQMGNHATMSSILCYDLKIPQIGFFKLHENLFCDQDFGFL